MGSRFQTQALQQPKTAGSFYPPGKFMEIDERVYGEVKREPEQQVAYGSGVATGFKGIYRGAHTLIPITNPQNANPIVNYGSYIYQQRTGYQGHQTRDMNRLYM
jgi:hypothetical protein